MIDHTQAANIFGTTTVVKKYHFTETRGANLTDADGALLQCAPPSVGGALTTADGGALATKSADLDAASGVLQRPDGGSLAVTGATMRVGALDDSSASCEEPMDDAQERRHRLLFERTYSRRADSP